jgi:hypothetical protein
MDKSDQLVMRAEQAVQVLENPLFAQAFADTRTGIMEAWAKLPPSEERKGEYAQDLHRMIRCLAHVEKCLVEHINTGKLAQKQIEGKTNLLGKRRIT